MQFTKRQHIISKFIGYAKESCEKVSIIMTVSINDRKCKDMLYIISKLFNR